MDKKEASARDSFFPENKDGFSFSDTVLHRRYRLLRVVVIVHAVVFVLFAVAAGVFYFRREQQNQAWKMEAQRQIDQIRRQSQLKSEQKQREEQVIDDEKHREREPKERVELELRECCAKLADGFYRPRPVVDYHHPTASNPCFGKPDGNHPLDAAARCSRDYVICRETLAELAQCERDEVFEPLLVRDCLRAVLVPACNKRGEREERQREGEVERRPIVRRPVDDEKHREREPKERVELELREYCAKFADGFYRHPKECARFVQCVGGKTLVLNCANGTVFNADPKINTCDFPQNVPECFVAWLPERTGGEHQDCAEQSHGAFLRHESDCRKFYRCVWGRKELMDCPGNLFFNPRYDFCDYQSNVPECRSSPERRAH